MILAKGVTVTLARAAVLSLALVATTALSSPALAASTPSQDAANSEVVTLDRAIFYGDFATVENYTVKASHVLRHDYFVTEPGAEDRGTFQGKLRPRQVKELQKLITSDALARESKLEVTIGPECGSNPIVTWTLKAGSIEMSAPTCNITQPGYPDFPAFNRTAGIIVSAQFEN